MQFVTICLNQFVFKHKHSNHKSGAVIEVIEVRSNGFSKSLTDNVHLNDNILEKPEPLCFELKLKMCF